MMELTVKGIGRWASAIGRAGALGGLALAALMGSAAAQRVAQSDNPDLPPFTSIDEQTYHRLRAEHTALIRGWGPGSKITAGARAKAIKSMEQQIQTARQALNRKAGGAGAGAGAGPALSLAAAAITIGPTWSAVGPSPIPNGQTNLVSNTVTGRLTTMVIDPTNSNVLYVGSAQGGVWRSLDGGNTFTPIFDSAQSLAIGALTLDPNNHQRLWVGTGEPNGSADSFAGVGLYRVDNADTTPVLNGPINPVRSYLDVSNNAQNVPAFNGRSISKIIINPNDSNQLYVGLAGGVIGFGDAPFGGAVPPLGLRGLYRLGSATGPIAAITVERIAVRSGLGKEGCFDNPCTGNRNINDMLLDPADPSANTLIVWLNGTSAAGDGGVWRSTNALAAVPAFAQTFATTSTSSSTGRGSLTIYKPALGPSVLYAASGESSSGTSCGSTSQSGAIRRSTDGGLTWTGKIAASGGFCGGQCFYNIGLAVVGGATPALDRIHLGGNTSSASCQRLHARSNDGGSTFSNLDSGLHADTHFIYVDPITNTTVYHLNDGGLWKSLDSGATWTSLNANGLNITQFQSVAVHPIDRNFSIGGTQDNGTNNLRSDGTWNRVDFGDGGFALIDQNATDLNNVTMYHTYFNQTNNLIGFGRTTTTACASDGNWAFKGIYGGSVDPTPYCDGSTDTFSGISLSDPVLFYAPMALGPGNPNTVYFGTNKLYRSSNRGDTMSVVSQSFSSTVSAIGISPKSDLGRIVGGSNGQVFATTTGTNPMANVTGNLPTPLKYVARAVFDPNDVTMNTAYVALGGYWGNANGHVYKTSNLAAGAAATWAAAASGIPDVPVNSLVIDPANSTRIFAGTDIGVYASTDAGATWVPYGTGLPRVAVFDMAIQAPNRVLRVATHGRGMWSADLTAEDRSSSVSVTRGGFRLNRGTGRFVQQVILTNVSAGNIPASVSLVLDGLSANATLYNPAGTTGCTAPAGSPFVTVNVGADLMLTPGEQTSVTLEFVNPTLAGITYSTRVLGPGCR